jgi:hypothetical protein
MNDQAVRNWLIEAERVKAAVPGFRWPNEMSFAEAVLHELCREWQPIETCPKSGLNFLACSPASSVFYANGVVDSSDWSDDGGYRERYATHWMPLPPPASA